MANYNSKYAGNTLITMHNIAHTANHLFTVQLVNSPSAPSTKTNFKAQYFYFVTLAPGKGSGGSRTYDFTAKVNLKFSIAEVMALSFTLQQCAVGNTARVLPYSKFSKSETGQKTVSIAESVKQSSYGNSRQITIFVSCNGQKNSINLSPAEAYALAKQLELSSTEATKLEFARLTSTPNIRPASNFQQQPEPMPAQPMMPAQPPMQMPAQMPPMQPPMTLPFQTTNQDSNVDNVVNQFSNTLNARN